MERMPGLFWEPKLNREAEQEIICGKGITMEGHTQYPPIPLKPFECFVVK